MNIDLIIAIVSGFLMAILSIFVIARNSRAAKFSTFVMMCLAIIFWIATNYLVDHGAVSTRYFFAQLSYAAPPLVVTSFLLFVWNFNNTRSIPLKELIQYYVLVGVGVLLAFSNTVIAGVTVHPEYTDIVFGKYYAVYLLYVLIIYIWSLWVLLSYRHRLNHKRRVRDQVNFILLATMTPFLLILVINGIMPLFTKSFSFAKYTPLSVIAMAFIIAYTIIRHRLFDIRLILARSVTYLLSIVTIGVLYGIVAFDFVDQLFFSSAPHGSTAQQSLYALLAVLLAFTFQPIKRTFEKLTDKVFFKDNYDAQLVINNIGRLLASEIDLDSLSNHVLRELTKEMRITYGNIIVLGDDGIYFSAGHVQGMMAVEEPDLALMGKTITITDDLAEGEHKDIMVHYGIAVAVALRVHNKQIGYLLLGDKLSGNAYTSRDVRVVRIIANELSVAVDNAKAYAEIQRFNETLKDKVTDATRKLRKANEDLKTLDKAKDEFISMASHQLRTPLTTAKGYVSMILDGDYGKPSSKMQPALAQALDSSNRMAGLINDLLNVSRMDAGKFFIDATQVDLDAEVQGELNQLTNLAKSKQVSITYHGPSKKLPTLNLDLDKTRQVIMNIIDNAIYYCAPPKGGGKIEIYLEKKAGAIEFRCVDNGIGVPDAVKPKLFAKFYRASNAQSTRPDGTGLGLYLVKRVIEDQGGSIIFESQEGKGSTFGFSMPIDNQIKVDKAAAKRMQAAN